MKVLSVTFLYGTMEVPIGGATLPHNHRTTPRAMRAPPVERQVVFSCVCRAYARIDESLSAATVRDTMEVPIGR